MKCARAKKKKIRKIFVWSKIRRHSTIGNVKVVKWRVNWSAQDECNDSMEILMIGQRGTNAVVAWEMIFFGRRGTNATAAWTFMIGRNGTNVTARRAAERVHGKLQALI